MKKILFSILLLVGFGSIAYLHASPNDSDEIVSLVKSLYKEDTRTFLRIEMKEPASKTIKYYQRFFTPETSEKLAKNLTKAGITGPFQNSEDPRYSNPIDSDPYNSDWYKHLSIDVQKINFCKPLINGIQATLEVDTRIKDSIQTYSSVYYLVKTKIGWRISNIIWGPKGEFEENSMMGLSWISMP
jgi:hypothetical protein